MHLQNADRTKSHVIINAMNLRPGGGLQVMAGLLSRFSDASRYTVLWTDPDTHQAFLRIVGERKNVSYANPLGKTGQSAIFLWSMTRFAGWLVANRADCVLSVNHHYPSGSVPQIVYHLNVLRFERQRGKPWSFAEISDKLRDWRAASALRLAAANVFESQLLLGVAGRARGRINNSSVVYIGIDEKRAAAPAEIPSGGAAVSETILAITSAEPHKDNPTLMRMLRVLKDKRPELDWRLKIAGGRDPSAFGPLLEFAAELKVRENVVMLGFMEHSALAREAENCLCLVTASLVESFCMVALEAMAWGLPVVAADISAMPESLGDAGLLARPGDAAHFAEEVLKIHGDASLRASLVATGSARAAAMTWTNAASRFEEIFASAQAAAGNGGGNS